jgi:hypothetical protein
MRTPTTTNESKSARLFNRNASGTDPGKHGWTSFKLVSLEEQAIPKAKYWFPGNDGSLGENKDGIRLKTDSPALYIRVVHAMNLYRFGLISEVAAWIR